MYHIQLQDVQGVQLDARSDFWTRPNLAPELSE